VSSVPLDRPTIGLQAQSQRQHGRGSRGSWALSFRASAVHRKTGQLPNCQLSVSVGSGPFSLWNENVWVPFQCLLGVLNVFFFKIITRMDRKLRDESIKSN
jgi:hypothetical protein